MRVCLLQQFMFQRQQEMEGGYMQQQHQQAAAAAAATGSSIMAAQGLGSTYGGWVGDFRGAGCSAVSPCMLCPWEPPHERFATRC